MRIKQLTFGYSPRDILFLKTITRLATFYGIIPSYDCETGKLTFKRLYRWYALVIGCFVTSCSIASMYCRLTYEKAPRLAKIMDSLAEEMGLILYLTLIFGSSFWNTTTWEKLISRLSRLEGPLNFNTKGMRNTFLKDNPLTLFISGCVLYACLNVCDYFYIRIDTAVYHISHVVLNCIKFMLVNVMYYVTLSIRVKYEDLSRLFLDVNPATVTGKDTVKTIRKIRALNLELDNVVDTFNSFFGWPVLLLLTHSFVQIVCALSFLTLHNFANVLHIGPFVPIYVAEDIVSTTNLLTFTFKWKCYYKA